MQKVLFSRWRPNGRQIPKLQLFVHQSSEITHFDALSLGLGLIWYIIYLTHTTVTVLKSKMVDRNGRQTAKIKGINKNHSIHHFLSTILLQELAKVEKDCRGRLGLTRKFNYILSGHKTADDQLSPRCGRRS